MTQRSLVAQGAPSGLPREAWAELFPEPTEVERVRAELARLTPLRVAGGSDPRMAFSIGLPPGFREQAARPSDDAPTPVWRATDASGAEIAIYVAVVAREVNPADWAELQLERLGHHRCAAREQDTPMGRMADLLTRGGPDGAPTIARTNMIKDGPRLFFAVCAAPETTCATLAYTFLATLISFRLTAPEGAPHAEALLTYSYLEPAILSFLHPASFELMADGQEDDTFDVRLDAREEGRFLGSLHATARPAETPRRFVADHFERLRAAGIRLTERGELTEIVPPSGFDGAARVEATGTWGTTPVLVEVLVLTNGAATVLLAGTGPTRAHDGYGWAVTRRALAMARDTLGAV